MYALFTFTVGWVTRTDKKSCHSNSQNTVENAPVTELFWKCRLAASAVVVAVML